MNVLAQTLKRIADEFGTDTLRNGKKTVALFVDLAPQHKQEQTMLRYLIQCGGNTMLLDALNKSSGEQQVAKAKLIKKMMDDYLVSQQAATAICDSFWTAIGGKPIPTTNTSPDPDQGGSGATSHGTNNGQGSLQTGGNRQTLPKSALGGIIAAVILVVVFVLVLSDFGKNPNDGQIVMQSSKTHTHSWNNASCTAPKTCSTCGATEGGTIEHNWIEATSSRPKTCLVCGRTEGTALHSESKPLSEFEISAAFGKVWIRGTAPYYDGSYHTRSDAPDCWKDWSKPGYTGGTIKDNQGNIYDYGIHIDGWDANEYYYEIRLNGKYTTFSGVCACPEKSAAIFGDVYNTSKIYTKYFEVYGDEKLLFTSATMRYDYEPQSFEIDVAGIQVLKILYPANGGPNETATIYNGMLN